MEFVSEESERQRIVPVERIIGILEGEDFRPDWSIASPHPRSVGDAHEFHSGRIASLLGDGSPDSRWSSNMAEVGTQPNRLPELTLLHGWYWGSGDGNHRIIVAKSLGYPKLMALVTRGRLRPNTPSRIRRWLARREFEARAPSSNARD